jgi:hypothetical protein
MPDRTHQRPNKANALASWDNEGGAAKGAPQKDRDDLTFLDKKVISAQIAAGHALTLRLHHHWYLVTGTSAYGCPKNRTHCYRRSGV